MAADEQIGSVSVGIRGDYSELPKDFDAAIALAVANGKTLQEAVAAALKVPDTTPVTSALQAIGKTETEVAQQFSAGAQAIIDKQKAVNDAVHAAQAVVAELKTAYDQGKVSAETVARAQDELSAALKRAETNFKEVTPSALGLSSAAQAVVDQQNKLNTSVDQARGNLNELKTAYDQGKVSAEAVARAQQQLDSAISAATPKIDESTSALKRFTDASGSLVTAGAALTGAITVPIAAIGKAAFDAAETFDDSFDKIRQATGATGTKLESLQQSFRTAFANVPASAKDVADAVALIHQRTDLVGPPLDDLAAKMLNLARLSGEQVVPLTERVTRAFGDAGIAVQDQSKYMDQMFRASQATGVGLSKLIEQVVYMGAPMRDLKFSFEESIALIGKWEKEGVNMQIALGGLRIAMGHWAKDGVDSAEAFRGVVEQIKNAGSSADATAIALANFGSRAAKDWVDIIRGGHLEMGNLVDSIRNGSETINKAAADTASFGEKWQLFKNHLTAALEPLGVTLINALSTLLDASRPVLNAIQSMAEWFGKLPEPVQLAGVGLAALAAAIGPLVAAAGGVGFAIQGITAALEALGLTATTTAAAQIAQGEAATAAAAANTAAAAATTEATVATGGLKGAVESLSIASGAGGLAGVLSGALVLGIAAAAAGFYDLKAAMADTQKKYDEIDEKFQKWITNMVSSVKSAADVAAAEEKVNTALAAGSITKEKSVQLLELLDDSQKKLSKSELAEATKTLGIAIDTTSIKIGESAKTTGTLSEAHKTAGSAAKEHASSTREVAEKVDHFKTLLRPLPDDLRMIASSIKEWEKNHTALLETIRKSGLTIDEYFTREMDKARTSLQKFMDMMPPVVGATELANKALKDMAGLQKTLGDGTFGLDALQKAYHQLGLTSDGTKEKMLQLTEAAKQALEAFRTITTSPDAKLEGVLAAWESVRDKVKALAHTDLKAAIAAYESYAEALKRLDAPQKNLLEAQRDMLKIQIDIAKQRDEDTTKLEAQLKRVEEALKHAKAQATDFGEDIKSKVMDPLKKMGEETKKALEDAFDKLPGKLADVIVEGGNFKGVLESLKSVGEEMGKSIINALKNIAKTILEDVIEGAISALKSALLGVIKGEGIGSFADVGGAIKDSLKGLLGLGAKATETAVSVANTGAAAASAATNLGTSAAGVAGTAAKAAGSLVSMVGAIGGVVGAIGSVIGAVATMRTEGTLNVIETNTKITAIILRDQMWPLFNGLIPQMHNYLRLILTDMDRLVENAQGPTTANIAPLLEEIKKAIQQAFGTGGESEEPIAPGAGSTPQLLAAILNVLSDNIVNLLGWQLKDLDIIAEALRNGIIVNVSGGGMSEAERIEMLRDAVADAKTTLEAALKEQAAAQIAAQSGKFDDVARLLKANGDVAAAQKALQEAEHALSKAIEQSTKRAADVAERAAADTARAADVTEQAAAAAQESAQQTQSALQGLADEARMQRESLTAQLEDAKAAWEAALLKNADDAAALRERLEAAFEAYRQTGEELTALQEQLLQAEADLQAAIERGDEDQQMALGKLVSGLKEQEEILRNQLKADWDTYQAIKEGGEAQAERDREAIRSAQEAYDRITGKLTELNQTTESAKQQSAEDQASLRTQVEKAFSEYQRVGEELTVIQEQILEAQAALEIAIRDGDEDEQMALGKLLSGLKEQEGVLREQLKAAWDTYQAIDRLTGELGRWSAAIAESVRSNAAGRTLDELYRQFDRDQALLADLGARVLEVRDALEAAITSGDAMEERRLRELLDGLLAQQRILAEQVTRDQVAIEEARRAAQAGEQTASNTAATASSSSQTASNTGSAAGSARETASSSASTASSSTQTASNTAQTAANTSAGGPLANQFSNALAGLGNAFSIGVEQLGEMIRNMDFSALYPPGYTGPTTSPPFAIGSAGLPRRAEPPPYGGQWMDMEGNVRITPQLQRNSNEDWSVAYDRWINALREGIAQYSRLLETEGSGSVLGRQYQMQMESYRMMLEIAQRQQANLTPNGPPPLFHQGGLNPRDQLIFAEAGEVIIPANVVNAFRTVNPPTFSMPSMSTFSTSSSQAINQTNIFNINGAQNPREIMRQIEQHFKAVSPKGAIFGT